MSFVTHIKLDKTVLETYHYSVYQRIYEMHNPSRKYKPHRFQLQKIKAIFYDKYLGIDPIFNI